MCETVAFNVPPEISKNRLLGPRRAQKAPKGPPKKSIGPSRRPPERHLGDFWPPKTTNEKKTWADLGGLWGQMYVFLEEKRSSPKYPFGPPGCSRRGLWALRWPIWPPFEILGGPWDHPFRPLGRPGTPQVRAKKNKNDFSGHLGGANVRLP